jgi:hypothetical protein
VTVGAQRLVVGGLIGLALVLRLYLVVSTAYVWDEDREWIPLGHAITLADEPRYLPWRSLSHPALSAYLVKATSALLGDHPMGNRIGFVIAGTLTVLAVTLLAWEWLGFGGAVVAALVLGLNEYHLGVSAFATEKSPYLMWSAWACLCLGRFLLRERPGWLYLAAAAAGLAFLFKETAGLLLPVFLLALVAAGRAAWLRRPEMWVAAGIGGAVVLPDVIWNIRHWDQGLGLHTGRVQGLGLTLHYLLFFGRDLARDLAHTLGLRFFDPVDEYPAMNAAWGLVLVLSAATAAWQWKRLPPVGRLSAIWFWSVLGFFVFTEPAAPRLIEGTGLMVDTKAWFWVDQLLVPGALLASWLVVRFDASWRLWTMGAVVACSALSTAAVFQNAIGLPSMAVAMSPNVIAPGARDPVAVRASVFTCQRCDASARLVAVRVNRFDGRGPTAALPGDVAGADIGSDDRDFVVLTDAAGGERQFLFDYTPGAGPGGPSSSMPVVSGRVSITTRRIPEPFWRRR